jgi:hypothetical protein
MIYNLLGICSKALYFHEISISYILNSTKILSNNKYYMDSYLEENDKFNVKLIKKNQWIHLYTRGQKKRW